MIFSLRKRRDSGRHGDKNDNQINFEVGIAIPTDFRCPISLELMKDPVALVTGITYDRESIERWIEAGNQTCPVTNRVLSSFDQIPNHTVRKMIQNWCVENSSFGIERIPTPRVPVTPYEVSEACQRILVATKFGDQKTCKELVVRIKNWGKESQRNKKCIVENGAGCALSAAFESFVSMPMERHADLLKEILSVLTWMFPLGVQGQSKLGSLRSLRCLVWLLKSGDFSARRNAVLVLKEMLSLDKKHVNVLVEIEGVFEALVNLIKEPISPAATKASLVAIFYMISSSDNSEKIMSTFVEMGLVSLVIEILVEADKGLREKGLSVLDCICDNKEGRQEAIKNALIVPLLIEKIKPIPDVASELSVSIFWKLCENERGEGRTVLLVEAIQEGAIQKLLVLLQVGWGHIKKEKVYELLKLLNAYRGKLGCDDSLMDFKYIRNPY